MMATVARAVLALAVHCLGERRRDWARAMEAEFEAAGEDGKALSFAAGCLVAAWRELPAHEEGRFALASHALAFAAIIPIAALLLSSVLPGFPHSYWAHFGIDRLEVLWGNGTPLLSDANRAALPSLALLLVLLAGCQLRLAWLMLQADWGRMAPTAMITAAITVTLVLLTGVVFDHYGPALVQAATLGIELATVSALARWHRQLLLDG